MYVELLYDISELKIFQYHNLLEHIIKEPGGKILKEWLSHRNYSKEEVHQVRKARYYC